MPGKYTTDIDNNTLTGIDYRTAHNSATCYYSMYYMDYVGQLLSAAVYINDQYMS